MSDISQATEQNLFVTLGRVEGKLDSFAASLVRVEARLQVESDRIGRLENSRAWIAGAAMAGGAVVSFIVQHVFGK